MTDAPEQPNGNTTPADATAEVPDRRRFLQLAATSVVAASGAVLAACRDDRPSVISQNPPGQRLPAAQQPLPIPTFEQSRAILSEPMLQNPGADSVRVVWFTEARGTGHRVRIGDPYNQEFAAVTTEMSHMLEDRGSQVLERDTSGIATAERRSVFRHEATVTGLPVGLRVPYVAISQIDGQDFRSSREYTLQPLPARGQRVQLLMTSDHQNNRNCSANAQKVEETVGRVDAILWPGDLISNPNRASEWFDRANPTNPSFFQSWQGSNQRWVPNAPFRGGDVMQHACFFPSLGNHEYPGRWRLDPATNNPGNTGPADIGGMDNDPQPRWYAEARYQQLQAAINPSNNAAFRARWIEDNSYEWTTYREMWSLPSGPEGKAYYAQAYGDVFIISMDANRIWRTWNANQRGKFTEQFNNGLGRINDNADTWGFGDLTFRNFGRGSQQYQWLQQTLASPACRSARYRIVISHQTMAGLGDNGVPVQAMQRVTVELTDGTLIGPFPASEWPARWPTVDAARAAGRIRYIRYEYPLQDDIWLNDIEPLLLENNVHMVQTGHSHVWNRCISNGLHYIETSNQGNSFGAYFYANRQQGVNPSTGPRGTQPGNSAWTNATVGAGRTALTWNPADYPGFGEPHGRQMILPTIFNPMREMEGTAIEDVPFVASNVLVSFSVFDSQSGFVSSYVYDTRNSSGPARKFDEFRIGA